MNSRQNCSKVRQGSGGLLTVNCAKCARLAVVTWNFTQIIGDRAY